MNFARLHTLREHLVLGNGRAGNRRTRGRTPHRLGFSKSFVEALRRARPRRHNFRLQKKEKDLNL